MAAGARIAPSHSPFAVLVVTEQSMCEVCWCEGSLFFALWLPLSCQMLEIERLSKAFGDPHTLSFIAALASHAERQHGCD